MTRGALADVRVLDFTHVLAGPHAGRILADLGAEVVKIETPQGDLGRFLGPRSGSTSRYFAQQNAGKQNLSIDLNHPDGRAIVQRLAGDCDVVLENFRPGVMAGWGLGYDAIAATNPGVVYASLSGWGQHGPWSQRRAYAVVVHAEAGLVGGVIDRGGAARNDGFSHADVYSGLHCAIGVLAALAHRSRTGEGQHVDVAMAAAMIHANEHAANELAGDDSYPGPYDLFEMSDGTQVTVASDPCGPTFDDFCLAMQRPDLQTDPRFTDTKARDAHRRELHGVVQSWVSTFQNADALESALSAVRIPVGVVRRLRDIADTEWSRQRKMFVDVADGSGGTITIPSPPWKLSATPAAVAGHPAWRGQHNRQVLARWGIEPEDVTRLEAAGVLSERPPRRARGA